MKTLLKTARGRITYISMLTVLVYVIIFLTFFGSFPAAASSMLTKTRSLFDSSFIQPQFMKL